MKQSNLLNAQFARRLFRTAFSSWQLLAVMLIVCMNVAVGSKLYAQSNTIAVKGKVMADGEPVIGATVLVKGVSTGTATDMDGNFSLNVASKAVLVVSSIGYETQEVPVNGRQFINVVLKSDVVTLKDVVVVGYGVQKKVNLTGAVSSVSTDELEGKPISNVLEAMQGTTPGLVIQQGSSTPGSVPSINIRGLNTMNNNDPLVIIDGIEGSLANLNPADIEQISILKDASSTAIYGARGANGVIIITTKSGQEGKIQVNLGASFGVRKVTKMVDVLNPYEYVLWQQEIDQEGMKYGMFDDLDIYKSMKGTDYQDEIFGRTGNQQQYNVSVSGGNKDTKFSVSYAHNEEKSIMLGSGFSKENINAKLNTNINKWLTMDFNARFSYQTIDGISGGADANESSAANSLISRSVIYKPVEEINTTSSDSDDDENVNNAQYNPLERLNATYKKQTRLQ